MASSLFYGNGDQPGNDRYNKGGTAYLGGSSFYLY